MTEPRRADKDESHSATRRRNVQTHRQVRDHQLTVDEPIELGGDDAGRIRRSCWR